MINALQTKKKYQARVKLDQNSLLEIQWWLKNPTLNQGKSLLKSLQGVVIQTDASKKELGCSLSGTEYSGTVVSTRIRSPLQHSRAKSSISSHISFCQDDVFSLSLLSEYGRYPECPVNSTSKGYVDFLIVQRDHNYGRTSSGEIECQSRLDVQKFSGLQRMASSSMGLSNPMQKVGNTRCRPVCVETVSSGAILHVLETGSGMLGSGCTTTTLGKSLPLCISSVFANREGVSEGQAGQSMHDFR